MKVAASLFALATATVAVSANPLSKRAPKPGSFEMVGDAGISAQMVSRYNEFELTIADVRWQQSENLHSRCTLF